MVWNPGGGTGVASRTKSASGSMSSAKVPSLKGRFRARLAQSWWSWAGWRSDAERVTLVRGCRSRPRRAHPPRLRLPRRCQPPQGQTARAAPFPPSSTPSRRRLSRMKQRSTGRQGRPHLDSGARHVDAARRKARFSPDRAVRRREQGGRRERVQLRCSGRQGSTGGWDHWYPHARLAR